MSSWRIHYTGLFTYKGMSSIISVHPLTVSTVLPTPVQKHGVGPKVYTKVLWERKRGHNYSVKDLEEFFLKGTK